MTTTWDTRAACLGADIDTFFGSATGDALALCATCPVRAECLADELAAMRRGAPTAGVRGGTTPRQRARMVRTERGTTRGPLPGPINHGTYDGARQHQRRGEAPCGPCCEAYRAHRRAREADRRARITHGTWSGYVEHLAHGRRPCALCGAVLDTTVMRGLRAAAVAESWRLRGPDTTTEEEAA